jgi:hypothetical protein
VANDPQGSFRTHAAYLRAFSMLAGKQPFKTVPYGLGVVADRVRQSSQYTRAQRSTSVDLDRLARCLRNAWGSELLLALSREFIDEDEVVRLSNNWNVVMAYYIAFHGTHAVVAGREQPAPPDHTRLRRQYGAIFVDSPCDLTPFSFARGSEDWCNLPPGERVDSAVHVWAACTTDNCLSIASSALKSTRRDQINDALAQARAVKQKMRNQAWRRDDEERKQEGKKLQVHTWERGVNLTVAERQQVTSRLRKTSYIDYLYRLRIRSNYEDSTMFTDGPEDSSSSLQVRSDITYLSSAYMLTVELLVLRLVGRPWLEALATAWAAANLPQNISAGVHERLGLLFP